MNHICTLFEGHYHYGLGAFLNSLANAGFSGTVWAGFRGSMPKWADRYKTDGSCSQQADSEGVTGSHPLTWPPAQPNGNMSQTEGPENTFLIEKNIKLVFIRQENPVHFTFQKPDFMLSIWDNYCPDTECMYYFDPDILLKANWSFFEQWTTHGIALCEDVGSPFSKTHPIRLEWTEYLSKKGATLLAKDNCYVNGGFIGLHKSCKSFLTDWKYIQSLIQEDIAERNLIGVKDRSYRFHMPDQDALNIAKDRTTHPLSIADKNAMDFIPGGYIMAHAIGNPKPWKKNFMKHLLRTGNRPTSADRLYFKFARKPIDLYANSRFEFFFRLINLKIAILFGRLIGS